MINSRLNQAQILLQQGRYTEAEKLLKEVLVNDPNDANILALLAEAYLPQGKLESANQVIDSAISMAPDWAPLFFIKARIVLQQDKYDECEQYLKQALQLDPTDADCYALWASVKLSRKQYKEALQLADQALEFDSEHILGLNTRSTALLKLDRKEDSFQTIEGALREDPNNPYTHANYGWNLLEKGDHKQAMEHFREALKNDPNLEYAQAGMLEALKANNFIYRLFLKYAFWMGNLAEKGQWIFIIGFYLAFRFLRTIANNNEALEPLLTPILILLAVVAFSTWIINPISNLFLRLNVYGRHLLDKKEIMSSNFVGISLLISVLGLLAYLVIGGDLWLMVAAFGFVMMVPCSVMFSPTKSKNALVIYTIIMAAVGLGAIANAATTGEVFNLFTPIFILGFVAFQWIANFMLIKQGNV